jgi:hypothetical protein
VAVIGGADLAPAGPIVHHFLLVSEVSKVSANDWTKFLLGSLVLKGMDRNKRRQDKRRGHD